VSDRRVRERIQPYLSKEVAHRLERYCAANNLTESAAVERALVKHLDGMGDFDVLQTRLKNINRTLGRIDQTLDFLLEGFGYFVELWLAYLVDLPPQQAAAHRTRGELRFERYKRELQARLEGSRRKFAVHFDDPDARDDRAGEGAP